MATKNNPGEYDCYASLEPDEPYFLLKGKDPNGSYLVGAWVHLMMGDLDGAIKYIEAAHLEMHRNNQHKIKDRGDRKMLEALKVSHQMYQWYIKKLEERINEANKGSNQVGPQGDTDIRQDPA